MYKNLYCKKEANYPRLNTDTFFADYDNLIKFNGVIDKTAKYIEDFQLHDTDNWFLFVRQFRELTDTNYGWRGEYWGKMMRGACFVYSYSRNEDLYEILCKTVEDMVESAEENGRISTFPLHMELLGWDLWCRKYVLLGMQYFLEICKDENLSKRVIDCMCKQVDCIMERIGRPEEGKFPITKATFNWNGLNSSSILEPVVRLYTLTEEKKYFDFAQYIVDCGGTDIENFFKLAYDNELCPYQYPVTKAYEMISCFEGLLEFYRITGVEWYKTSVINFGNRVLESDFTIIGCGGCTHELFDNSTVRQSEHLTGGMQETCVTVTMMKFFYQLLMLTGDPKYADAYEISLYNAYLGAVNTEKVIEPRLMNEHPDWDLKPLPFDSYSPLTAGVRGIGVGGLMPMENGKYYGCCACIGSAGIGLAAKIALLTTKCGFAYNLFEDGVIRTKSPAGNPVTFTTVTNFPVEGNVKLIVETETPEEFELLIRNPSWSKSTSVQIEGKDVDACDGYISFARKWEGKTEITVNLDMRTKAIYPVDGDNQVDLNKGYIAFRRGPITLAQENRLGYSVDDPVSIKIENDGYVNVVLPEKHTAPYDNIIEVKIPLADGEYMTLTDYASAGKLWTEETKMAAWILVK